MKGLTPSRFDAVKGALATAAKRWMILGNRLMQSKHHQAIVGTGGAVHSSGSLIRLSKAGRLKEPPQSRCRNESNAPQQSARIEAE